jgi:predicted nucleic acid-binding protein
VVDASIAVAWVHPGQATPQCDALLAALEGEASAFAPALWPVEVANALLGLERRAKLTRPERDAALTLLRALPIEIDQEMSRLAFTELSGIAAEHKLSVYDAAYFELALRLKIPLACKDGPLREAGRRRGIKVLPDR